ncbi:hypothetical protein BDR07DRAFT_1275833 [Suillus spraguei]|nr:hypothetical protein BDR07DRAFT_1275833 [Suillus spraguei]
MATYSQLGQITMDNASNNNTLMVEIEELKKNPCCPVLMTSINPVNQSALQAYARTLEHDPVGQCHAIVSACQSSGQHRCRLHAVIQEGNENGFWRGQLPDGKTTLPAVQLLCDCITRWSSTFRMIDRVLILNPVCTQNAMQSFLLETQNADISDLSMDAKDIDVLHDIHQIIEVPHVAQELLSSEWTPTLSMALPAYEVLSSQWTQLRSTIWELSHYIDVGLNKLKQYINEGRKTRIYALSMIVNPSIKLEWLKEHWEAKDVESAQEWMLQVVCHFLLCTQLELSTPSVSQQVLTNSTAIASRSLSAGLNCVNTLKVNVRRSSFATNSTIPPTPTIIISEPVVHSLTPETAEEHFCKELKLDRKDAECEFSHYEDAGILLETAERTTDIVHFWEQKEHTFLLLFCIAMDILPAQASSVPSDNLSPTTLEALQVLKFIYKQDRLNFTEDLVADERDYTISGPVTSRAVDELMAAGNLCELDKLLQNARDIDYN